MRFTALASGSRGNASLLESNGFGLLIDAGLPLADLTNRLEKVGAGWSKVHALLLTHTHSDHWSDSVFSCLHRNGILLCCHAEHRVILEKYSRHFSNLQGADLVFEFPTEEAFSFTDHLSCQPVAVRHDSGATFAFRIEGEKNLFDEGCAIGYASDLGCWDDTIATTLANVDLLAVEHNHDVRLQWSSRRPYRLITRVLGNEGHLSNEQAAELIQAILLRSEAGRLRHVVQLHLSEQCNRPALAVEALQKILSDQENEIRIHTARQSTAIPPITIEQQMLRRRKRARSRKAASKPLSGPVQQSLPGLE